MEDFLVVRHGRPRVAGARQTRPPSRLQDGARTADTSGRDGGSRGIGRPCSGRCVRHRALSCGTRPGTSRIAEVLGDLGAAADADSRVSVPERPRSRRAAVDGPPAEWDARRRRADLRRPREPPAPVRPDFARWIDVMGDAATVAGTVGEFPTASAGVLPRRASRATLAVPVFVGRSGGGSVGFDDCDATNATWTDADDRSAARHGGRPGRRGRAAADEDDPPLQRGPVPLDGRARPGRDLHRRRRRPSRRRST